MVSPNKEYELRVVKIGLERGLRTIWSMCEKDLLDVTSPLTYENRRP